MKKVVKNIIINQGTYIKKEIYYYGRVIPNTSQIIKLIDYIFQDFNIEIR